MDMSLSLSANQRKEIERGRPLFAVVGSSKLKCVVVRAELIERLQYLSDATPDAGIQEAAESLAERNPEDWNRPEEWRVGTETSTGKLRLVLIVLLAVAASAWALIATSRLSHVHAQIAQAESDGRDAMTAALYRLIMDFQRERLKGTSIHAFHRWLPLATRSENDDGTTSYSWTTKEGNIEGPGWITITVDRDERVLMAEAMAPDW